MAASPLTPDSIILERMLASAAGTSEHARAVDGSSGTPPAAAAPELARQLIRDGLTGLYNRAYFDQRLQLELEQATPALPLGLYLIDLNGFKQLNDRHGHLAGDQALRQVAQALQAAATPRAAVCRLGGDEFAVLVPGCVSPQREWLESHLGTAVDFCRIAAGSGTVAEALSASIGLALAPAEGGTATALLGRADAAMYAAKRHRQATGEVPGSGEPVPVGEGSGGDLPLVGRDELLAAADHLLDQAAGGAGSLVFLSGPPGIGKSRLAQEVAVRAGHHGYTVVAGHVDLAAPMAAVQEATSIFAAAAGARTVRSLVRRSQAAGHALAIGQARTGARPEGMPTPGTVAEGVRLLLAAAAKRRPVLWLLDDVRMADSTTLALLRALAPFAAALPVLLLAVARTEGSSEAEARATSEWWQGIAGTAGCQRWEIPPLSPAAAADLAGRSAAAAVPAAVWQMWPEQAGGNPLHILRLAAGHRTGSRTGEGPGPASIGDLHSLLVAQLDALPDATRQVLYAAAVLGYKLPGMVLEQVAPVAPEALPQALAQLAEGGWLRRAGAELAFTHALAQEVAYECVPPPLRRSLHRLAGQVWSETPGHSPFDLVRHFRAGEDRARACAAHRRAGAAAEAALAGREAAYHYVQHLTLSQSMGRIPDGATDLLVRAANLLVAVFERQSIAELEPIVRQMARTPAELARGLTPLVYAQYDDSKRAALNRECLDLLRPLGPSPELAQALVLEVGIRKEAGEDVSALAEEAIRGATALDDLVSAVRWVAGLVAFLEDPVLLDRCLAIALGLLPGLPSQPTPLLARALMNVAWLAGERGRLSLAQLLARRAWRIGDATGDTQVTYFAMYNHIRWLILTGRCARALGLLQHHASEFRRIPQYAGAWLELSALAHLFRGDITVARSFAVDYVQAIGLEWTNFHEYSSALHALARVACGEEPPPGSWSGPPAERARRKLRALSCVFGAQVHIMRQRPDLAQPLLRYLREYPVASHEQPAVDWVHGHTLLAEGSLQAAAAAFRRATNRPGIAYYRALAHRDLAQLLLSRPLSGSGRRAGQSQTRQAIRHLRAAMQLFQRIGNEAEVARLAQLPDPAATTGKAPARPGAA